ncbi:YihY/virulence factor BrkB family protein [Tardiphaga sp.]|uniref:YihY/virulence factor BrkB family protein n=1 Tax=Tardiphaga sp. TaxID=1926292 RepID=UPI00260A7513|nr:YihY/virulence factor BrkB family protein [Tardiphaga sp.]MDB5618802.1 putative ribonuclease [Tardiphaga sp.]
MTPRRPDAESLALVAAGAFAVWAVQSYLAGKTTQARLDNWRDDRPDVVEPQLLGKTFVSKPSAFHREIKQHGRGRRSTIPFEIPWAGWKDILWRTYDQINEDRLLAIAAGVVFFGLLAVFPAITALVSCYGLFANPSTIAGNLQTLAYMLPDGTFQIVQDQIARVLSNGQTSLGLTFLFGLALALWSANAGVKAVIDALNVVYGEREKRSFIKLNLLSLGFTTGAIAALLLMVGAVVALPLTLDRIGLEYDSKVIISLLRWPVLLVMLLLALGILYRFGPSRPGARWPWLGVGTVVAALLWIAGSSLLSWYLSNFANYSATYGSLGAAIGLMTWMWMSAIIVLCGAELNSEIEHQTAVDTTIGPGQPMGARGAAMADTLGRAAN